MVSLKFSRKKAVFAKTNYSPLSFSLGPIYEQIMSEIDFSICATVRSIFVEISLYGLRYPVLKQFPFQTI